MAAGEVIENPASVVKELVENSLDAGASEILVEIQEGGRNLIRVTDNGEGMSADDAMLSLERHATSKIREINDLHTVLTKGFRGEAIPSIASISKFSLMTRLAMAEKGSRIVVEGGKIVEFSLDTISAIQRGTTIEVRSLFFNIPVRKKFQSSPTQDVNAISKAISILALSYPSIKFTLISNGKQLLKAPVMAIESLKERLGERIVHVLGKEFFNELCFLEHTQDKIELTGYIGVPSHARHNRSGQYLFINERAVFCPLVSNAVKEGYGTTLASQRHPVYLLYLKLPPEWVDVNVHPQKKEVRLRQGPHIREAVIAAIKQTLSQKGMDMSFFVEPSLDFIMPFKKDFPSYFSPEESWSIPKRESVSYLAESPPMSFNRSSSYQEDFLPKASPESFSLLKPIATVPGYILLRSESALLNLIDQRAAHARILFEQLKENQEVSFVFQSFLIPLIFETTPEEASVIQEHLSLLKKGGIILRPFGSKSFEVEAAFKIWNESDLVGLIRDVVQDLKDLSHEKDKKFVSCAFRLAISSKKHLSLEEAEIVVSQLARCNTPLYCPLGKKIVADVRSEDLALFFRR